MGMPSTRLTETDVTEAVCAAMDHLPHPVTIWRDDLDGDGSVLVYANRAADAVLGIPLTAAAGWSRDELFPPLGAELATHAVATDGPRPLARWFRSRSLPLPSGDVLVTYEPSTPPTGAPAVR